MNKERVRNIISTSVPHSLLITVVRRKNHKFLRIRGLDYIICGDSDQNLRVTVTLRHILMGTFTFGLEELGIPPSLV